MIHRDEVHGDITYDKLGEALLDTPQLQRLGRVYQLGYGHLVYRGGNHSRLSHAMGTYSTAAGLANALQHNYESNSDYPSGALPAWRFLPVSIQGRPREVDSTSSEGRAELGDRWSVLRHLVCWAALLHDVGHVPLGHTLEDEFENIYERHDALTSPRLRYLWLDQRSEIRRVLEDTALYPDAFKRVGITSGESVFLAVLLICTWKEKVDEDDNRTPFEEILTETLAERERVEGERIENPALPDVDYGIPEEILGAVNKLKGTLFHPYMADLVANTISADYLDYLRRDPHNLGLDVLRDGRIVSRFWVGRDHLEQARMALSLVDRRGKPRLDTCTGVVELVRQRYRFAEIVYYHKTKVAASAMLAKAFQLLKKPREMPQPRQLPTIGTAAESAKAILQAPSRKRSKMVAELIADSTPVSLLDPEVGDETLDFLLRQQAFRQLEEAVKDGDEESAANALRGLALLDGVARRNLYKTAFTINAEKESFSRLKGYAGGQRAPDPELRQFITSLRGDSSARDRIERKMAAAADLPEGALLLYVPDRKSQAKGIETGALSNGSVITLQTHFAVKDEVANLSRKYKSLWRCIVLVHPDYAKDNIRLSEAIDAFMNDQFPGTDLSDSGVVKALEQGAWFRYLTAGQRPAAREFMQFVEDPPGELGWEGFKEYGRKNEPCTPRQHSLGAALVYQLTVEGADPPVAVEQVKGRWSAEGLEQAVAATVAADESGSFEGEDDAGEALRATQRALGQLATGLDGKKRER